MKDGHGVPCTINKIDSNIIYCTRYYNDKAFDGTINLIDVEKYVVAKNSIIEDNIKYDPNILYNPKTEDDINKESIKDFNFLATRDIDTIYLKDGSKIICTLTDVNWDPICYQKHTRGFIGNGKVKWKNLSRYSYGPVKAIEFTDSIIINGQKPDEIYDNVKNWFTYSETDVTKKIDFESKSLGIIKGAFKIAFLNGYTTPKDIKSNGFITINVSLLIKNDKLKYTFSNYKHEGNNYAPGGAISFQLLTTAVRFKNIFNDYPDNWQHEKWLAIKNTAISNTNKFMNELREIVNKLQPDNK